MKFLCEDLREHGVVLIPPTSREFEGLLDDIQNRLNHPVEGSPPRFDRTDRIDITDRQTSAILVNISERSVAAIQQVRHSRRIPPVEPDHRPIEWADSTGPGARNSSVLLPFGLSAKQLALYGYWHVILPGSKRYVSPDGQLIGNNTDVRPPIGDEMWAGGIGGGGGSGGSNRIHIETITLSLDGVFFTDGTFAGPNTCGLFEKVTESAEAHRQILTIAKHGQDRGDTPAQILAQIQTIAPPAERPPSPRSPALLHLGYKISWQQLRAGDERTLQTILSWADAELPNFRKL